MISTSECPVCLVRVHLRARIPPVFRAKYCVVGDLLLLFVQQVPNHVVGGGWLGSHGGAASRCWVSA
jgi:hypothetical protein